MAEVKDIPFPELLHPVDDLPPATVITGVVKQADGKLLVRGASSDNGAIVRVLGQWARGQIDGGEFFSMGGADYRSIHGNAYATDDSGNVEKLKHEVMVK